MNIGLIDVDKTTFPNLCLMKLSAYHKNMGDDVEFAEINKHYDKIYVSSVFSEEYRKPFDFSVFNTDEMVFGGTGFALELIEEKEVFINSKDKNLPYEIEHIYPDYSLYPNIENKAYGFLTRGCPNNCGFCLVTNKEGHCSKKVANLNEFWNGQKEIVLMDANILACRDMKSLLNQLIESKASIDFNQGLDLRFITEDIALLLKQCKVKHYHFAFDFMRNENEIVRGLKIVRDIINPSDHKAFVYVLTNYDTTFEQDFYRIKLIQSLGFKPDVRIYRKPSSPQILRYLQRWCNNKFIYYAQPDFGEYIPRKDNLKIKDIYKEYF